MARRSGRIARDNPDIPLSRLLSLIRRAQDGGLAVYGLTSGRWVHAPTPQFGMLQQRGPGDMHWAPDQRTHLKRVTRTDLREYDAIKIKLSSGMWSDADLYLTIRGLEGNRYLVPPALGDRVEITANFALGAEEVPLDRAHQLIASYSTKENPIAIGEEAQKNPKATRLGLLRWEKVYYTDWATGKRRKTPKEYKRRSPRYWSDYFWKADVPEEVVYGPSNEDGMPMAFIVDSFGTVIWYTPDGDERYFEAADATAGRNWVEAQVLAQMQKQGIAGFRWAAMEDDED